LTAAPSATTPSADDLLRSLAPAEFHLLGLTTAELKTFAKENGLPAFRGKQLRDHLYGATPRAHGWTISRRCRRARARR
jgi:hypothetical protein